MSKVKILLILAIVLNIILIILYGITKFDENNNQIKQTYKLGDVTEYGYVGVELTYDKEPVDIELITPSGEHIYPRYADFYSIDETNRVITLLYDTDELGEYQIAFNVKSNTSINYTFINEPSPTLRMSDLRIVKIDNYYYIEFTPYMALDEDDDTTCKYTVTLYNVNKSFVIDSGSVNLNETAYVIFNPNPAAYTGDMYDIRVSCQLNDNSQSAKRIMQMRLENNSEILDSEPYNEDEAESTTEETN